MMLLALMACTTSKVYVNTSGPGGFSGKHTEKQVDANTKTDANINLVGKGDIKKVSDDSFGAKGMGQ